ncbi:hypothetical protein FIV42_28160 [Persicimonas caeni]|uniref:Prolipoprotein diacylglyceryl transferase n=1 Tax=Persicimonas caeni TaxID=2292766 RepID=A0A4Y6Q1Y1_PERCE|nr:prolipoprotein diacylglyceryl transferase family protein [Persicimonas caeni]QDG54479.1 hypothetical protein FIV42_28160 [Persicimonas caeni]QED35700.1 hypothetical protein FRD00_28155 [Persicimonas caeni]
MNWLTTQLPAQSVWMGAGLLVAAAIAVGAGRMRRVPASEILALFGLCVVVGAASSRVFWVLAAPSVDIGVAVAHLGELLDPRNGGYSSFGAFGGAAAVVALWCYLQRHEAWALRAIDALVLGGLSGLALARVGCLANGCDFGRPAQLPWSIQYPAGSEAFALHVESGRILADASWSAPVHPFPLYMAAGTLLIVAIGLGVLSRGQSSPGRVAVLAAGAYLLWRFAMEWTRAPSTVASWGAVNIHHLLAVIGLGVIFTVARKLDACRSTSAAPQSGREK